MRGLDLPCRPVLIIYLEESLSRVEMQAHKTHGTLLAKILEQRMGLRDVQDTVSDVQNSLQENSKRRMDSTNDLIGKVDDAAATLHRVSGTTESINTTVMSFRDLGVQLLQMYVASTSQLIRTKESTRIHDLPLQVRETLNQVV